MTFDEAKTILGDSVRPDGGLFNGGWYLAWPGAEGIESATLDGRFTADELEAIAVYMRAQKEPLR